MNRVPAARFASKSDIVAAEIGHPVNSRCVPEPGSVGGNQLGPGGRFRPALGHQLLDPHLQVELDLGVDIAGHGIRPAELR